MEKIEFSPILLEKSKYKKCFLLWTNWESFKNHFDEKWDAILLIEEKIGKYVNKPEGNNECYQNYVKEKLRNYKRDIVYKLSEIDIHIDLSLVALTIAVLSFFIPFLSDDIFNSISIAESSLTINNDNSVITWIINFVFILSIVFLFKLFTLLFKGNKARYNIRLLELQLEIVNKYLNSIG